MNTLRGPMNPSTNHECGLLIDGFHDSPNIMMSYNPPFYANFLEKEGFRKAKDLYAYEIDGRTGSLSEKQKAQAEKLLQSSAVKFRTIRMSEFEKEIDMLLQVYNDAWEENWGFVPMTEAEFRHMAKALKLILDPELLLIAEVQGEAAGFGLCLPDLNQVLKKIPDGKLFPFGMLKLLWNLKGPGKRSTLNRCRIITLGIKKKFRHLQLGPLLYFEYYKRGPKAGYPVGEASWVLEDNIAVNKATQNMSGKRTKTYRIYDRPLQ
jgi:hypothetical protein